MMSKRLVLVVLVGLGFGPVYGKQCVEPEGHRMAINVTVDSGWGAWNPMDNFVCYYSVVKALQEVIQEEELDKECAIGAGSGDCEDILKCDCRWVLSNYTDSCIDGMSEEKIEQEYLFLENMAEVYEEFMDALEGSGEEGAKRVKYYRELEAIYSDLRNKPLRGIGYNLVAFRKEAAGVWDVLSTRRFTGLPMCWMKSADEVDFCFND